MRVAIAQINQTLGDFKQNKEKILDYTRRALEKKCGLVIFPEASLFGYHPFDLLERSSIVEYQNKEFRDLVKKVPAGISVLVGFFEQNKKDKGRPFYNSVALIRKGKVEKIFRKELLPTGDVFDEARFIEKGDVKNNFFNIDGTKFFLTICEDIWAWPASKGRSIYSENPLKNVKKKKIDLIINMSASPYHLGKLKLRESVVKKTAQYLKAPMVYVNLVGAQDEIIYDGASFLVDKKGQKKFECEHFQEDLNVFDVETLEPWNKARKPIEAEELRQALVLGIQDFCKKTGFQKVHFGLSGGIDSAVVACLAVDALGPNNVRCFGMPGPYNLSESLSIAEKLAKNLGVKMDTLPIAKVFETFSDELRDHMGVKEFGLVHENLQARIRGCFMMAFSNLEKSMLLTTGNKSEYATGYSTLYGDMCGGLAPLGDLTKQQVYQLAEHYNREAEVIPSFIITRPPSAELRPNQKDQDSLPPYEVLDQTVVKIVEKAYSAKTAQDKWLIEMIMRTEFKRWQCPPILKVSAHSFGRGRRYPIAHAARI